MKGRKLKVGADMWGISREPLSIKNDCWGETDFKHLVIRIDNAAPLSKVRETYLHEILHVVDNQGVSEDGLTENEVRRTSTWLAAVFHDNPWLKEVLFG